MIESTIRQFTVFSKLHDNPCGHLGMSWGKHLQQIQDSSMQILYIASAFYNTESAIVRKLKLLFIKIKMFL